MIDSFTAAPASGGRIAAMTLGVPRFPREADRERGAWSTRPRSPPWAPARLSSASATIWGQRPADDPGHGPVQGRRRTGTGTGTGMGTRATSRICGGRALLGSTPSRPHRLPSAPIPPIRHLPPSAAARPPIVCCRSRGSGAHSPAVSSRTTSAGGKRGTYRRTSAAPPRPSSPPSPTSSTAASRHAAQATLVGAGFARRWPA